MDNWTHLRRRLLDFRTREGLSVERLAGRFPAARSTFYRIIRNPDYQPIASIQFSIARRLEELEP